MEILEFCVQKLQSTEVDKFELFWEKSSSIGVEIHDGKLDHLSRSSDQGLSIRVLKNHKMGFSYTFDLSRKAVESAVHTALEVADLMPVDPLNDLCGAGFSTVLYPEIENYDNRGIETALEQKIEIARGIEADARRQDARIKRVRKAAYDESFGETIMVDWQGEMIKHKQSIFGVNLTCVAEEGADAEMGYESQYANYLDQLNAGDVAIGAAKNALELLHAGSATTMTCPAVFKNSVSAELLSFLSSSFSAENIDKNFSMLIGKKGERLFSEKLTIISDGLLPNGVATAPFDGEGTPSQTTQLVDHGLIQNFLYDNYYARKHKTSSAGASDVKSNASSRRGGIKSAPGVGPSNLYFVKGTKKLENLFADAGNGIYITDLMGLHTANPVTGEFSVGASGILIENGKLTKPVKGFAIAGNLIDLLQHVTAVGADHRFWGSVGASSLLVSKLSVGGA